MNITDPKFNAAFESIFDPDRTLEPGALTPAQATPPTHPTVRTSLPAEGPSGAARRSSFSEGSIVLEDVQQLMCTRAGATPASLCVALEKRGYKCTVRDARDFIIVVDGYVFLCSAAKAQLLY